MVDTLSVSQPKRSARLEQRKKSLEKIKAKKAENWVDDFALEVNTPNFNELKPNQIQKLQDEAVKDLISQYSDDEDYSFDETDIRLKALSLFENKSFTSSQSFSFTPTDIEIVFKS